MALALLNEIEGGADTWLPIYQDVANAIALPNWDVDKVRNEYEALIQLRSWQLKECFRYFGETAPNTYNKRVLIKNLLILVASVEAA